jgi:hypothetical protein
VSVKTLIVFLNKDTKVSSAGRNIVTEFGTGSEQSGRAWVTSQRKSNKMQQFIKIYYSIFI